MSDFEFLFWLTKDFVIVEKKFLDHSRIISGYFRLS